MDWGWGRKGEWATAHLLQVPGQRTGSAGNEGPRGIGSGCEIHIARGGDAQASTFSPHHFSWGYPQPHCCGLHQHQTNGSAVVMSGPPNPPGPPVLMKIPSDYLTSRRAVSMCLTWRPPDKDNGSRIQLYQVVMREIVDGVPVEFLQVP